MKIYGTYHRMHFLHDGMLCSLDRISGSDQADISLEILAASRRYIDLASGIYLHVLDSLTT